MAKSRFSPQVLLLIAILGYVFPTVLVYFFLIRPLFGEAEGAKLTRAATDEYLVLNSASSQLNEFRNAVIRRNNTRQFRAVLDSLVTTQGITLMAVEADTTLEELKSGFVLRTYNVLLEAQYGQLNNLIRVMEQPNEYYMIEHMNLIRIDNKTGRARVEITLVALTTPSLSLRVAQTPREFS
jgi:hypothetical protein